MVVIARSMCLMYGVIGLNLSSSRIDKGGSIHHHHPPFFKMMHLDDGVVMSEGWISIHRKILEWEWYSDINVCRVFIHCLIKANHTEKKWQGVAIKRGQFITSNSILAHECNLSVKQLRTSLNKLKETGEVASNSTNKYTVISMLNYEKYQDEGKQTGKRRANEGQTKGKRRATTNNDNNDNNEDKERGVSAKPPSPTPKNNRATRLKEDWELPDDWGEATVKEYGWSVKKIVDISEAFKDYWIAKSGKNATKVNWEATWRSWCRIQQEGF